MSVRDVVAERSVEAGGRPQAAEHEPAVLAFVRRHERALTWVAGAVVVAGVVGWWMFAARGRKERAAEQALQQAQAALQGGDMAQGVSALTGVIDGFRGTLAAHQAVLVLNEVRLSEGQAALAAQELARYAPSAPPQFRAQAFRLSGVAWENTGDAAQAGEAYSRAAESTQGLLASRLLLDAARAYAAGGDSGSARGALERILKDHGDAPAAVEARVRLAELTARGLRR